MGNFEFQKAVVINDQKVRHINCDCTIIFKLLKKFKIHSLNIEKFITYV